MRHLYFILIVLIMFFACPLYGAEGSLTLVDNQKQLTVSLDSLRQEADLEFTIYAPYRAREVRIRGLLLETLLKKHLSRIPQRIKLIAHDGYELTFNDWPLNHWVLVTHEDGHPLSLRQQGPLRLIERDYTGRDPKNLRNFNDWVWMLSKIETLP